MNQTAPTVREQYLAKYGMDGEQVWRRAKCEMGFIKSEDRQDELTDSTYDSIHALAERILDEHVERSRQLVAEWKATHQPQ